MLVQAAGHLEAGNIGADYDLIMVDEFQDASRTRARLAEERRLFYVALTRARRAVLLISHPRRMSPFVIELLDGPHVIVTGTSDGPVETCPGCGQGRLVERNGRFGPFLGCSTFPACRYTRQAQQRPPGDRERSRRERALRYDPGTSSPLT
jgi:hypothetical protein